MVPLHAFSCGGAGLKYRVRTRRLVIHIYAASEFDEPVAIPEALTSVAANHPYEVRECPTPDDCECPLEVLDGADN